MARRRNRIKTTKAEATASFAESRLPTSLAVEWASIARDPNNPAWAGMLQPIDPTLATRGSVQGLALYDQVLRDAFAKALLAKRMGAVVAREWHMEPGGSKRADKQAAELVKEAFAELRIDQATKGLLGALLKGYAVGEVMWERRGGLILPAEVRDRDPKRFGFDEAAELRLRDNGTLTGEALPARKFIVHAHDARYGNPYGLGLGSVLWWLCFFKQQGTAFWLTFADRFASPTVVGRYAPGTPKPEQDRLLRAAHAAGRDTAVVLPEGLALELMEAARSGGADVYEGLSRWLDEQMAVVVLGETLTTSAGQNGSRALGSVHNEVRLEVAKQDADLLSDTLNATLVRWIVDLNAPGAAYPKFWRDFTEPEDLAARAERDTKIRGLGFRPTQKYIDETYGEGWEPDPSAQPLAAPGDLPEASPAEGLADFAEGEAQEEEDLVDVFAAQGAAEGSKALGGWVAQLKELVDEATSLEALRATMGGLLGKLKPGGMVDSLRDASLAAHLGGQAEVRDGR